MLLVNPATGERTEVEETPLSQLKDIVARGRNAQRFWRQQSLADRIKHLSPLVELFEEERKTFAEAITIEMGKPLKAADFEVQRCIDAMKLFFAQAPEWLADEPRGGGYLRYEPLGTVLAITPWNFPLSISMFSIVPALICGNTVVWKPSEYAVRSAQVFDALLAKLSGIPSHTVSTVIGGKEHGKQLVEEKFDLIAFTGSTQTGKYIAEHAAKNLSRLQLELGGLDAAIVLGDVDVRDTAQAIVKLNASNSGQVCCAVKRVYVDESIYNDFLAAAVEASKKLRIGDPMQDVDMGPLVGDFQIQKCDEYLNDAVKKGAKVLSGGKRRGTVGYFFEHTVLSDVAPDTRLLHEEAFSPILPVLKFRSVDEAIQLANDSKYALTASVWTKDSAQADKIASQLDGGVVGINRHGVPPVGCPWGGAKESGVGRMRSPEGFRECCNLKFITR